jgi:hypothetical protein
VFKILLPIGGVFIQAALGGRLDQVSLGHHGLAGGTQPPAFGHREEDIYMDWFHGCFYLVCDVPI